ncbi:OLC1v1009926C1 [Oldenlandia corymbosa var. corymbosa]|uniref:OLC1v1009926C1 n=1 Tax=Oldenlandia corymbosa var. corymbosa TaxID=529605 RepID=A0AAV1DQ45_OLDCO|nr:OLC1v1009926C1 [Oldenlandia corymbosa var. corymbosa]
MKMEFVFLKKNRKVPILITAVTTLLIVVSIIGGPSSIYNSPLLRTRSYPSSTTTLHLNTTTSSEESAAAPAPSSRGVLAEEEEDYKSCDIFAGEWVRNPDAPYYTNATCWAIHEHQNCMKYGRPDDGFMKWRWKPDGCELPIFNPKEFLELMTEKYMAFVGDSIARNQFQSLICLLSRVEYPIDISADDSVDFKRFKYPSNNFTLAVFFTSFLVKSEQVGDKNLFHLYLDEFDEKWTTKIHEFDYVIISAGQWFPRPSIYYENNQLLGCRFCQMQNISEFPMVYAYRKAWRTAFKAIQRIKNRKSVTFLRTVAPSHFEGGEWNQGGNCLRKKPFSRNETSLEGSQLELYSTQLEEFRAAEREGEKEGLRFRLLDVTRAMLLRPDGHPSRYGHLPNDNVTLYNDCVHWCLPGPIDSWSDFLLQLLKMEERRSYEENTKERR